MAEKGPKWEITQDYTPGFIDKPDVTQLKPGALIRGSQNVVINDGDRVANRKGFEQFGDVSVATDAGTSIHSMIRRSGVQTLLRAYSTFLEYHHTGTEAWENLNDGYTTGLTFGIADHVVNTDASDFVYFCNGEENYSRWNGAITQLNGALAGAEATINVDSTTGFTATGSIRIGTSNVTYSGVTATSFTGCAGTPAASDDAAVAQAVTEYAGNPKGNIFLVENTRMYVGNVKDNQQGLYYSAIADATDFTFGAPRSADEGGIIDTPEGGGGITGIGVQEDVIYLGKASVWKSLTFTQTGAAAELDLPIVGSLIRSVDVGPLSSKAVFNVDNELFYVSSEGGLKSVTRAAVVDFARPIQKSDPIVNLVRDYDFSDAAGIFFKRKAYIACRQEDSDFNDVVLVYNFEKNAWEAPIIGWNVADWTIHNDGLHFISSLTPNVYKAETGTDDDAGDYTCIARFPYQNYGIPQTQKSFQQYFIEGYISPATTLTFTMRYNYLGGSGSLTTTLVGTDATYIVSDPSQNELATVPLATEPLGATLADDLPNDLPKFRVVLRTPKQPFYEASFEVRSEGVGQEWEVLRHGPLLDIAHPSSTIDKQWS